MDDCVGRQRQSRHFGHNMSGAAGPDLRSFLHCFVNETFMARMASSLLPYMAGATHTFHPLRLPCTCSELETPHQPAIRGCRAQVIVLLCVSNPRRKVQDICREQEHRRGQPPWVLYKTFNFLSPPLPPFVLLRLKIFLISLTAAFLVVWTPNIHTPRPALNFCRVVPVIYADNLHRCALVHFFSSLSLRSRFPSPPMRLCASLAGLAGYACLVSAAAVPRIDAQQVSVDTTCTSTATDQGIVTVTEAQDFSTATPLVVTVTLSDAGSFGSAGSIDTSCTTLSTAFSSIGTPAIVTVISSPFTSSASVLTITISGNPTGPSAAFGGPSVVTAVTPSISTVTVPVLTVTGQATPSSPAVSVVTATVTPGGGANSGSFPPFTIVYTVPTETGLSTPEVATVTVTPAVLSPPTSGYPGTFSGTIGTPSVTTTTPALPAATNPAGVVVTYTVPATGNQPAYTGEITITPGIASSPTGPATTFAPGTDAVAPAPWTFTLTDVGSTPVVVTYSPGVLSPTPSQLATYTYTALTNTVAPWTFTLTDVAATPVVVTYTPGALSNNPSVSYTTSASAVAPWTFTLTDVASTPVVVTYTPGVPVTTVAPWTFTLTDVGSIPVVVTYTPGVAFTGPGTPPSSPSPWTPTVTDSLGVPIVVTYTPGGLPSSVTPSTVYASLTSAAAPWTFTLTNVAATPVVVTYTPGVTPTGSIASTDTLPPWTVTLSNVVATPIVVTYTPGFTSTRPGASPTVPSLSPWTVTVTDVASTPAVVTYTPATSPSSPVVVTYTQGGSANTLSPLIFTLTNVGSTPVVVTYTPGGTASTPAAVSYTTATPSSASAVITYTVTVPGYGQPGSGITTSKSGFVVTYTVPGSASSQYTVTYFPSTVTPSTYTLTPTDGYGRPTPVVVTYNPSPKVPQVSVVTVTADPIPSNTNSAFDPYGLQSGNPSEITLWPLSPAGETYTTSVDTCTTPVYPCTTLLTSYRSSLGGSESFTTLLVEPTEEPATQPEGPAFQPPASSSAEIPPPQTELEVLPTSVGGYVFSFQPSPAAGYGNPVQSNSLSTSSQGFQASITSAVNITSAVVVTSVVVPITSSNLSIILSRPSVSSRGVPTSTRRPSLPTATCGGVGDRGAVIFKFDDIPTLSLGNDSESSDLPAFPVPFPYHRFFFSAGFAVVPPPSPKYAASSGEQLVQYDPSISTTAVIGLAQLRANPCFRFSFLGVSLGCNSTGAPCIFNITGLNWNGTHEVVEARHEVEVSACKTGKSCRLSHEVLDSAAALPFANLTSINVTLTVGGRPERWWADDLQLAWTENDCGSAACRAKVPNTIMVAHHGGN
ncbi:hypothetical protein QBC42DRAFT_29687 [Cladorrhinum samala]|uniref:DUF7371 domain-containing protein n=1 Tax=Cladorrhinum samala TaxID=585594 RepID=A0AAV9I151_9PEZI|nr:hypothetical protein QBC42DRAFT_29687 [Cladorrhinum samala]